MLGLQAGSGAFIVECSPHGLYVVTCQTRKSSWTHVSETSLRMSEHEVHAVANALFSELHIVDLNTFTAIFQHDAAGVLAVLKGEGCRAAADAAAVSPVPVPAADVMAMALQIQVMRDELRTVEQEGGGRAAQCRHISNHFESCRGRELATPIGASIAACCSGG